MRFQPLRPWLNRHNSVTPDTFYGKDVPDLSKGILLALDLCVDLHEADKVDTGNLQESWEEHNQYIESALQITRIDPNEDNCDLDNEEKEWVKEELGEPPYSSYNLYFITIYKEGETQTSENPVEEKVVYIGKTDARNSRFANGHLAALRLHHPKYQDYKKRVYFGTITFISSSNNYLPLEFVYPLSKAKELLSNTEALLISWINPELNTKNEDMGELRCCMISIENYSDVTKFMHGHLISGY